MEQQLLFLINRQWTTPALDLFMAIMSSFNLWLVPLVVAALAVAIWGGFRARAMLAVMALALIVVNTLAGPLKSLVHRPRPHEAMAGVRKVELAHTRPAYLAIFKNVKTHLSQQQDIVRTGNSFPSAHVLNNFSMAFIIAMFYRLGWLFYIPAATVAYSRIYAGDHWPGDVFVSMFLGTGIAMLCLAISEMLWRKFGPRILPSLFASHPNLRQNTSV